MSAVGIYYLRFLLVHRMALAKATGYNRESVSTECTTTLLSPLPADAISSQHSSGARIVKVCQLKDLLTTESLTYKG